MYDVIVVGGGHAGIESAHATSKCGLKTLLVTGNIKNIGDMPCNPSIGGSSKGIIVREIDALGGLMGKIADKSLVQMKMLNSSKGPAVRSLRAQVDKEIYTKNMQEYLCNLENLEIKEAIVENLIVINNIVYGVELQNGEKISSKYVILTTGTYLKSDILIGDKRKPSGPHGEKRSNALSDNLKKLGFKIIRLKTGTPPRLDAKSVDYSKMKREDGDLTPWTFSFDNKALYNPEESLPCYQIYTNQKVHDIIIKNLNKSSMYGGYVHGVGPRYCPSIEDKIVRFKDKERHILFLEPQSVVKTSKYYDLLYLQGFSTSMPEDVQEEMVHSLEGLENAKIVEYAYAIEYDAIDPLQIKPSLESKIIKNLFTAGQINGTSGYEEAAGQGIIAGINVVKSFKNIEPLILKRNEAYIGVLIDDLVTKGTIEPYRMLTSRAEYRLLLRHDNADRRLRRFGYEVGLISEEQIESLYQKEKQMQKLTELLKKEKKYDYAKRPEVTKETLKKEFEWLNEFDEEVTDNVLIEIKYEGYIKKMVKDAEKLIKLEAKEIPEDLDYNEVLNLANEAREKLSSINPRTIAQASRISGVNPSDISVLAVYLKKEYGKNE